MQAIFKKHQNVHQEKIKEKQENQDSWFQSKDEDKRRKKNSWKKKGKRQETLGSHHSFKITE